MLSGSFGTTFATGYRLQVDWSGTQDISANTTTITMNLYLISLGSSYTISSSATKTGSQTCDGSSNSFSTAGAGLSGNQKKLLNTFTHTVSHNSDGTKSISMSAVYNIAVTLSGTYYSSVSCSSGTVTLDTIPRASSLTSGCDWTAGTQNLAVTISRASTSFTHTVEIRVQKPDGTWVFIGSRGSIATSTTFTFTLDENTTTYQAISQYENRPSWVRLITYNGGSQIGYKDYYGTVYGAGIAKISFNNPNIGDNISATLTGMQNYTGFQYTGIFKIAGTTIKTFTFSPSTPNPTLTFTQAEIDQMYSLTPNSNSVSGQVTVTSKYNGVDINDGLPAPTYDPNFNFTAYVTNSNPTFSASSISYKDTNSTTTALTSNDQYIVQNKSSLTAYVNTQATAINGATLSKYTISIAGKSQDLTTATGNVNIGTINASTNQTLTVTAIDSRGNSTSVSITVNVLPYQDPTLAITLSRANKFDNNTTLQVSGTYSVLNVGGTNKNTVTTLTYHYKESGTSTWGSDQTFAFTVSDGGTFTATNVVINLDNTKAWDFEVTINDKVGSVTNPASVGAGQPILFIDSVKKSVGVGMFPTGTGTFETAGDAVISGKLTVKNTLDLNNTNLTGVNNIQIKDPGVNEGIEWLGGNDWKIYESPDDLSNASGNLQFVTGSTRRITFKTDGSLYTTGSGSRFQAGGQISTTDPQANAGIKIEGYNNILTMGTGNTNNDRNAWIQSRHNDPAYASVVGSLSLNPMGGEVKIGSNQLTINPALLAQSNLNTGIEIGSQNASQATYAFVDFHSSQYNNDYDGRIIYYGGSSGVNGDASLTVYAHDVLFMNTGYFNINAYSGHGSGQARLWYDATNGELDFWNQSNGQIALRASAFRTGSKREFKTNIELDTSSALDTVVKTPVYKYHLKEELNVYGEGTEINPETQLPEAVVVGQKDPSTVKKHTGLILDEAPEDLIFGDGIDLYSMVSVLWKAVQELSAKLPQVK